MMSVDYAKNSKPIPLGLKPVDLPAHDDSGAELDLIKQRLLQRIWSRVELATKSAADFETVPSVIQSYTNSHVTLCEIHAEGAQFIRAICEAHVVTNEKLASRPDELNKLGKKEVDRLSNSVAVANIPISPYLHAELVADGADEAFELLHSGLRGAAELFVQRLVNAIDSLAQSQVVGEIEWPVDSACRFKFFETHLYERDVNSFATTEFALDRPGRKEITTHVGEVDYLQCANTHQLVFATRHSLPNYEGKMPLRIVQLLKQIPDWLQPEMEIVEGDLFRKDGKTTQQKTETWTEENVRYDPYEPAVTFGTYVLAAWLPDETHDEDFEAAQIRRQHRQALADQRHASLKDCHRELGKAGLFQIVPLLIHVLGYGMGPGAHLFAMALSMAMLRPAYSALQHLALAQNIKADSFYFIQGLVSICCGLFAVQAGLVSIIYGSFPAFLALVVMSAAFIFFGREWQRQYNITIV